MKFKGIEVADPKLLLRRKGVIPWTKPSLRRFQCGAHHERDHLSKSGKPLIPSLSALVTDIDLGDNNSQAEESQGMIEINVMDGASAFQRW